MSSVASVPAGQSLLDKKMKKGPGLVGGLIFAAVILGGLAYCGFNIVKDMGNVQIVSVFGLMRPGRIDSTRGITPMKRCRLISCGKAAVIWPISLIL